MMLRPRNIIFNKYFSKKLIIVFLLLLIPIYVIIQLFSYDPEYSANKVCYTHKIIYDKEYSRSVEFFEDLLQASKQPLPSDTIFFVDSNCSSTGILDITPRQACSYESAARSNPHRQIFIIHLAPFGVHVDPSKWPDTISSLLQYPNINFRNVKLDDLYENTILENWSEKKEVYKAKYLEQSSDLARMLLLYRYGGTYLDSDFIILKNLTELGRNWLGAETFWSVNNAVIDFTLHGAGHAIAHQCLREFLLNFNSTSSRVFAGPRLVTRVLKQYCDLTKKNFTNGMKCGSYTILPIYMFYDIIAGRLKELNRIRLRQKIVKELENSYGIHLWNSQSKKKINLWRRTAMSHFAKQNCPIIQQKYERI